MAFGIPNSGGGSDSGPFLSRIQYDARSGFFTNVDRVMEDGGWENKLSEPYRNPVFAFDFGSFEVGYIKLSSPPAFMLVPYGQVIPPQPDELQTEVRPGEKPKRAFAPGFRAKVMSTKTFGDAEPRYFAGTSKSLMGAVEELFNLFMAAPESRDGRIPVVEHTATKTMETKGPKGTTKNYAPVFAIKQWIERPGGFGERTVPPPVGAAPAAPPPAPRAPAPVAPAPTFVPARVLEPVGGGKAMEDDIPFHAEFR